MPVLMRVIYKKNIEKFEENQVVQRCWYDVEDTRALPSPWKIFNTEGCSSGWTEIIVV